MRRRKIMMRHLLWLDSVKDRDALNPSNAQSKLFLGAVSFLQTSTQFAFVALTISLTCMLEVSHERFLSCSIHYLTGYITRGSTLLHEKSPSSRIYGKTSWKSSLLPHQLQLSTTKFCPGSRRVADDNYCQRLCEPGTYIRSG